MANPPQIEFNLYISPDGLAYTFDNNVDRFLMTFTGYGMPPIDFITQHGPFQHGETVLDYRLRPRTIQLLHRRGATSRMGYWNNRFDIINMLRINRQSANSLNPGRLRKILPDGSRRDLNVFIHQGPKFNPSKIDKWDEWSFQEVIRFIAHDPVFYDPTSITVTLAVNPFSELQFPIDFPIRFGGSTINETDSITYLGTWLEYPTIIITGPVENPIVTNTVTGELIDIVYNLPAGRVMTIDLSYGNKTITDDLGVNLIGTLSTSSDLATFHIAPDPEASGGVNTFQVQGSSVTNDTVFQITYFNRFIGI